MTRVLVVSASIGEGHDLPARLLAAALRERGAEAAIVDGLQAAGPVARSLAGGATQLESRAGNVAFDVGHRFVSEWRATRRFSARAIHAVGRRGLLAAVTAYGPEVVVSTYPGASEILGRLRVAGALAVPVASAVTDLASLHYWAHPGVDLHLLIHPESAAEVRAIAGPAARVRAAYGFSDPAFRHPPERDAARRAIGLPEAGALVVVSGGGWAVGDLGAAVDEALAAGARVLVLAGRNDGVHARLDARYAGRDHVAVWGFTEQMPAVLAAADVLVHSTAGLTVLEAMMSGCRPISFGWGRGHIRANNRAYRRFGLAEVAATPADLRPALARALAAPRPAPWAPDLPEAADLVLAEAHSGSNVAFPHP
ncbi:MAG: glycosyltransferase [Actinomycetota bacterium]|nr:glycosyltransferase [Actinomycetota bacterium]